MKILNTIIVSIISLFVLVSCGGEKHDDGLDKFRDSGQLIDLDYEEFSEMMIEDESFIFFLKRNGCTSCAQFYPIVSDFLTENKDLKLYTLNHSELEEIDALTISAHYLDVLGKEYYEKNGYNTTTLYTPTISKIINGEFVDVHIGVMDTIQLLDFYQDNYQHLDYYYDYNRKTVKNETFNLFVSKSYDEEYDKLLRNYFITNSDVSGYYLDCSNFEESHHERLLNRVNYYLGEENSLDILPDYYMLQYENGVIVNYIELKYDIENLSILYNK